jgi:hypothetical protein
MDSKISKVSPERPQRPGFRPGRQSSPARTGKENSLTEENQKYNGPKDRMKQIQIVSWTIRLPLSEKLRYMSRRKNGRRRFYFRVYSKRVKMALVFALSSGV